MSSEHYEIEIKRAVPRSALAGLLPGLERHAIEQVYLSPEAVAEARGNLPLPCGPPFAEWRLRRYDARYLFTAKSAPGPKRREFEIPLGASNFEALHAAAHRAGPLKQVKKTRYCLPANSAQPPLVAELDEFHATGRGDEALDFLICEVEFPDDASAALFQTGQMPVEFGFLAESTDVTHAAALGNRRLAETGFPADSYAELLAWLRAQRPDRR